MITHLTANEWLELLGIACLMFLALGAAIKFHAWMERDRNN